MDPEEKGLHDRERPHGPDRPVGWSLRQESRPSGSSHLEMLVNTFWHRRSFLSAFIFILTSRYWPSAFPSNSCQLGWGSSSRRSSPPCTRVLCSPVPDPAHSESPTLREGPAGGLSLSCPSDSRATCLSLLGTHPVGLPQWLGHPQVGLQAAGTQGPETPLGRWAGGVI